MTEAEFGALKPGDVIEMRAIDHDSRWEIVAPKSFNGSLGYELRCVRKDKSNQVGTYGCATSPPGWDLVSKKQEESSYEALEAIYKEALAQAQSGKGKERHSNGEAYEDQKIVSLNMQIGSEHGAIFQACKKAQESVRLQGEHGDAELLGAINYLAAAVLIRRKLRKRAEGGK